MEDVRQIVREEILKILGDYSAIPLEVSNAIALRLPGITVTGTGTAGTQTISTSGATATVPAQPSGTLKVISNGTTYSLLYA